MFTVSETLEAREAKIQAFAKQDAVIGVVLAAIHLEWCLVRCFLLMGTTSSKEMLTTRASKQDKHFALDEVSSFTGYEQAWAAEIEPIIHISWEAVFESIKRPESLIPARGTVTVKRKHLLPEVTDGASCVRYAMNCRNAFVHGEKGTTSPDHAQALLEIFFAAARALNEVALSQGVSLFGRRRCRRGAFGSAPQA